MNESVSFLLISYTNADVDDKNKISHLKEEEEIWLTLILAAQIVMCI